MKVGLVDMDQTSFANIALMQISAYWKAQGAEIIFPWQGQKVDKLYISVVFTKNRRRAEGLRLMFPDIEIGGTGWDIQKTLPPEIAAMKPDYDLYPIDYGIGRTSLGCHGHDCWFCVVPQKEGPLRLTGLTLADIKNPRSKLIRLLDNSFTALPDDHFCSIMEEAKAGKYQINFSQGWDFRITKTEHLEWLRGISFTNPKGTKKQIAVALDRYEDIQEFKEFWERAKEAGLKGWQFMVYILVGFNTTFEQDLERVELVRSFGMDPFVMPYKDSNKGQVANLEARRFARWVNTHIYKVAKWSDYRERPLGGSLF